MSLSNVNPKAVAAGAVAVSLIGLGSIAYMNYSEGRMLVTEDVQDLANKTIDQDTARYYSAVCQQINTITDTTRNYLTLSEQSIGKDTAGTRELYASGVGQASADLFTAADKLQDIDANAPTVARVDSVETNFSGALTPIINESRKQADIIGDQKDNILNSSDDQLGDTVSSSITIVNDGVKSILDNMNTFVEEAPIYSEATQNALQHDANCANIMDTTFSSEDGGDKIVVDGLVDIYSTVQTHHDNMTANMNKLNSFADMSGASPDTVKSLMSQTWDKIHDDSVAANDAIQKLSNPYTVDDKEYATMIKALNVVDTDRDVYADWATWSDGVRNELRNVDPNDTEAFQSFMEKLSNEIRDNNIRETRFMTRVSSQMPVPNDATADAISDAQTAASQSDPEFVNDSVVDAYSRAMTGHTGFNNEVNALSETLQSIERIQPKDALQKIAQHFDAVADSAFAGVNSVEGWENTETDKTQKDAATSTRDSLERQRVAMLDVANWSRGAAERLRNTAPENAQDTLTQVLDEFKVKRQAEGDAHAHAVYEIPTVNVATSQAIQDARNTFTDQQ